MAEKNSVVDEFLKDADKLTEGKKDDPVALLTAFVKLLKERGQFIEPNALREQFSEVTTVRDKNRVPIEVTKCLVCGNEDFEVKPED